MLWWPQTHQLRSVRVNLLRTKFGLDNGVHSPFAWFRDVLGRIEEHPIQGIDELLPHRSGFPLIQFTCIRMHQAGYGSWCDGSGRRRTGGVRVPVTARN